MSRRENAAGSALDWIFKVPKKLNFSRLYRFYFNFILRLLYRIFIIEGNPETVEETFLKLMLFTTGKVTYFRGREVGEDTDKLLALNCSRSDTPTVYYMPSKSLITNPRLIKSYMLTPGTDCEIVYLSEADKYNLNDQSGGLYHLIERTAIMLADNDLSINIAQKNTRLTNIVSGDTQNTVDSIRGVIAAMYEGDPTIVVKSSLIDKLQGVPIVENSSQQNLIQLIEVQQYILAHFYEQIGICTHDQMKKERLVTAEINDNIDLAYLNIDDILLSLQEGFDRVNAMFGTNITIKINPIIEHQREQADAAAALEAAPEEEPESAPEDQTEEESESAPEDQTEEESESAPEDQTEEESESAPEDQTEEESESASEDQTEEESESAPEDQTEEEPEAITDNEISIEISGDNNTIVIGGDDNADTHNGNETGAKEIPEDS